MPRTRWPGIYSREARTGRVYDAVVTHNYRQRMKRGFPTISDAKSWQAETREDMKAGRAGTAPARLTYREFFEDRWLPAKVIELRPNSRKSYHSLSTKLLPLIGPLRLIAITPMHIQDMLTALAAQGAGAQTRKLIYHLVSQSLEDARRWRLVGFNPCKDVDAPRNDIRPALQLDEAALQRLMSAASDSHYEMVVRLAVATGMRIGELSALMWADVDIAQSVAFVKQAKTRSGVRVVALDPYTVALLQAHRHRQLQEYGEQAPAYVLAAPRGGPLNSNSSGFTSAWKEIREKARLPGLHFHDLRHAHATLLARSGIHPAIAATRLGHSRSSFTLDHYTHTNAEDQRDAARLIGDLLNGKFIANS